MTLKKEKQMRISCSGSFLRVILGFIRVTIRGVRGVLLELIVRYSGFDRVALLLVIGTVGYCETSIIRAFGFIDFVVVLVVNLVVSVL